jgi:hypothetical protein
VGESYSDNLPLQQAFRKQFGPSTDAFVTLFCDPWLSSYPSATLQFVHTAGTSETPSSQSLDILTGCSPAHEVAEVNVDQTWVSLRYEGRTAPFKLNVEVNPANLAPGEYKAQIRVKVPAAFYSELTIPVTLTVVDPPTAQ